MLSRLGTTVLLVLALALLCLPASSSAAPTCSLYASTAGSDGGTGSVSSPLNSVQALADRLAPGQVGCLRAGTYPGESAPGDSFKQLKVTSSGITIQSTPGEVATIVGRVWIAEGANDVTMENLYIEGANTRVLPSPTVNGNNAVFRHVDVTNNHTSICFDLGNPSWGRASGTLIEESRVHDCGELPATNQDHGIYLSDAANTTIRSNWIYNNADRGIQLFPDAQNTTIVGNVINANGVGVIFSGDEKVAANGNTVNGNVISNSNERRNVESFYFPGGPHGVANVVQHNCIHGAEGWYAGANGSGIAEPQDGFSASENVNVEPQFVNAAAGDLRLVAGNGCTSVLPRTPDGLVPGVLSNISDQPVGGTATPSSPKGSVILKATRHRGAPGTRVLLKGHATGDTETASKARIFVNKGSSWHRVANAPLHSHGAFFVRARLAADGGVVRVKALIPGVGRSRSVKIHVT